jgi:hypothetical protein
MTRLFTENTPKTLQVYFMNYLMYVYGEENEKHRLYDYGKEDFESHMEDFKYIASNDYETGYDFVKWIESQGVDIEKIFTPKQLCSAITHINEYYREQFQEDSLRFITIENVLYNLLFVELDYISLDSILEILPVPIFEEEEEEEEEEDQ